MGDPTPCGITELKEAKQLVTIHAIVPSHYRLVYPVLSKPLRARIPYFAGIITRLSFLDFSINIEYIDLLLGGETKLCVVQLCMPPSSSPEREVSLMGDPKADDILK